MATTKSSSKKTASKKTTSTSKKAAAKKTAARKTTAKKATAKKATAKKTTAKKTAAKKTAVKKTTAKKATAKKTATSRPDAIAVLKADHQRVTELFDKFEGLGDRAHATRESIVGKIVEELSVHAGIEETVFYPAVRERFAARDEAIVLEALEEHHLLKLTLKELESMPSQHERYTAKVTVLRELVDHHVKEEESELFRQVRSAFTSTELTDLGDELTAARASAPTRPHPIAPDSPPGNILSNAVAAPLDAAADITTKAARAVRNVIS